CGTELVREPGEAAWMCPNKWGCRPQIIGRIEHFVGRHAMDIDGVGDENCAMLFDAGLVKDVADFYTLRVEDLENLEGLGRRSAQKILDGVRASLSVPFERVLYALSIPYVGETISRKIARAVGSIDRLKAMSAEEIQAIEDVGPSIAASIGDYFAYEGNLVILERLRQAGVQLSVAEQDLSGYTDRLGGKTFVISGVFARHSRDEYKVLIEKNGGKNTGSISKKTDYVLAGDNMGPSKLEKAQKLGIPIIDENQFLSMIGEQD
ncbi:MAG: NAD-dependent DNA ligase LigA, partial [Duncaniella sp.]|nr:NAD-dependent DNA ligase LigA [Duncaniella sp.]